MAAQEEFSTVSEGMIIAQEKTKAPFIENHRHAARGFIAFLLFACGASLVWQQAQSPPSYEFSLVTDILRNQKNIYFREKITRRLQLPEFCEDTNRCAALATNRKFSFLHISKCAGTAWGVELEKVLSPTSFPQAGKQAEWSLAFHEDFAHADYFLISLRSPRHQVWHLFTECKYDGWGLKSTRGTSFPRSGSDGDSDVKDFDLWLSHFVDESQQAPALTTDRYGCYHPANYQSRALTSTEKRIHGVEKLRDPESWLEPDLTRASANYWGLDFVSLTEFFHESKCLLFHRLQVVDDDATRSYVEAYLKDRCACVESDEKLDADVYISHHKEGQRSSIRDLPDGILAKVEALTRVDVQLYKLVLPQLLKEIVWLESEFGLNRRVLCDSTLKKVEPQLAYLGMNVTDLYYNIRGGEVYSATKDQ